MKGNLLDTNILSAVVRAPSGLVQQRIARIGATYPVVTSIIVAAELRFGTMKRGSQRLSEQVEALLAGIVILPFEAPADHRYAEIRTHLERAGQPISNNDLLIAAHALALGCVLVTDNVREFSRVPGLTVENGRR